VLSGEGGEVSRDLDYAIPIADDELLKRAVTNARSRNRRGYHYRFAAVMDLFLVGSTYATLLCHQFGLDPEEKVR
jgi:hypothetical protein